MATWGSRHPDLPQTRLQHGPAFHQPTLFSPHLPTQGMCGRGRGTTSIPLPRGFLTVVVALPQDLPDLSILWMVAKSISHRLETMVDTIFRPAFARGSIIPECLRWCEMYFVHPQYPPSPGE